MKFAYFNGGLGNQMFQYIFARYAEIMANTQIVLDDAYFFLTAEKRRQEKRGEVVTVHNGYEVERVFPKAKRPYLLSEQFTPDVWEYMLEQAKNGQSIPQQLLDNGMDLRVVAETENFSFTGEIEKLSKYYDPEILLREGDVYYHGYWLSKKWFGAIKRILLPELEFPPITRAQNRQYARQLQNTYSAAVHIRRGDFVKLSWELPPDYYYNVFKELSAKLPELTYFIFSDDIEWCKDNAEKLGFEFTGGKLVFIEGNCDKENNYVDMQLMSMAKLIVVGVSSFAYLASLLNTTPDLICLNTRFTN